jgi:hypothetical protein
MFTRTSLRLQVALILIFGTLGDLLARFYVYDSLMHDCHLHHNAAIICSGVSSVSVVIRTRPLITLVLDSVVLL